MKLKAYLIAISLLLVGFNLVGQSGSLLKIDSKFGFRDIRLESDVTAISKKYSLTKKSSDDIKEQYNLNGFNMYIDDMYIDYITLEYIDGKLYSILIKVLSDKKTRRLTELIEESYGKITQDPSSRDYYIKGKKAELIYQIKGEQLSNGYMLATAYLTIRSLKLKERITGTDNGF